MKPSPLCSALLLAVLALPAAAQHSDNIAVPEIDHMIRAEWNQQKVVPAKPVDDAGYLRRVYLDVVGKIPPVDVVQQFLNNRSPNKRAAAVATLLNSPEYASNWTNYWDDILMGHTARAQNLDRVAWRQWLSTQMSNNVPWNKFVYSLITASGQNSTGGAYSKMMGLAPTPAMAARQGYVAADHPEDASQVNGAVNWYLKYLAAPADLAGSASKIFLGVQIQCAQCHDHKTEKWKQDDFRRFAACFIAVRPQPVDKGKVMGIRRVDLQDAFRPIAGKQKALSAYAEYAVVPPATLNHALLPLGETRRKALADWMTAPENPWFAEAIVNRMWGHFMGRGFIEPIDDIRPSNPAIMPDLLKRLSDDFVAHNYDLKHLVSTITSTQAYQLSSGKIGKTDPQNLYWERYRLKAMGPEQMVDSLVEATGLTNVLQRTAGGNLDALKFRIQQQFTFLFDVDEEFEHVSFEGTIPQALMMLNGQLVSRATSAIPGTTLADVLKIDGGDAAKVEALYLKTLSRKPDSAETAWWVNFLHQPRQAVQTAPPTQPAAATLAMAAGQAKKGARKAGPNMADPFGPAARRIGMPAGNVTAQAYQDMFWTLLNSSEFIFNH